MIFDNVDDLYDLSNVTDAFDLSFRYEQCRTRLDEITQSLSAVLQLYVFGAAAT